MIGEINVARARKKVTAMIALLRRILDKLGEWPPALDFLRPQHRQTPFCWHRMPAPCMHTVHRRAAAPKLLATTCSAPSTVSYPGGDTMKVSDVLNQTVSIIAGDRPVIFNDFTEIMRWGCPLRRAGAKTAQTGRTEVGFEGDFSRPQLFLSVLVWSTATRAGVP